MKEIVVASNNLAKLQEIQKGLALTGYSAITYSSQTSIQETGQTYLENARIKAIHVMEETGKPALGDDGGIEISSLPNLLGVKTARYFAPNLSDRQMNQVLLELLEGKSGEERRVTLHCVQVYVKTDYSEVISVQQLSAYIAEEVLGSEGYGFDEIIYLKDRKKTLAEISEAERLNLSPRVRGIREIIKQI